MRALLLLFLAAPAAAQYEIQVYGSATTSKGSTFAELHSNATAGVVRETLEVTHGWTPVFETGFYVFSAAPSGEHWRWAGAHVRPRLMAPASWGLPFGASLSGEVGYFEPRFTERRFDYEVRPILDKRWGKLYASVNPALESEVGATPEFSPAVKVSYDLFRRFSIGVEYYGAPGEGQFYPVVDLIGMPEWELNVGPGFGYGSAEELTLKLLVGRRF